MIFQEMRGRNNYAQLIENLNSFPKIATLAFLDCWFRSYGHFKKPSGATSRKKRTRHLTETIA